MLISRTLSGIALCGAILVATSGASLAQTATETGTGTEAGDATGADGLTEPGDIDTSAFEQLETGTLGGSVASGLGSAETGDGAANTAGRGGVGGGFGGLGALFGGLGQAFGGNQGSTQRPIIRTRIRSAVEVAPLNSGVVQSTATRRLSSIPRGTRYQRVNVTMDGRTAILSGAVGSEKERRMSQLLMSLEPGVSRVENRVIVSP